MRLNLYLASAASKIRAQIRCVLVTQVAVFLERLVDDPLQVQPANPDSAAPPALARDSESLRISLPKCRRETAARR